MEPLREVFEKSERSFGKLANRASGGLCGTSFSRARKVPRIEHLEGFVEVFFQGPKSASELTFSTVFEE